RNGSGKTTLLRILAGIYQQTSGRLVVNGSPRPLFSCSTGFRQEFSVVDNIYLFGALHGLSRGVLRPLEQSLLEQTALTALASTAMKDLSLGQAQRLALAIFALTQGDFLILDEVAAHIANVDRGFRLELEDYFERIATSSGALLMTSHDPLLLRRYCRTAL